MEATPSPCRAQITPWVQSVFLKTMRELCGRPATPIRAGIIADHVGLKRRRTTYYLAALEQAGLVMKASPKKWIIVN